MTEIEKLEEVKNKTWREYETLRVPADAAYKKHDAACKAYKEAMLYEKAKRQVMRDLINAAGAKVA
jgi:vacuolar-type H+-ATPase subunit I/STV1